ncbi:MAG TPA: ribosome maturation factor RimM [Kiritimatiellia bacterium]|nr:ribosome maturation factor RimM [Kiritimatiellia bacterium]
MVSLGKIVKPQGLKGEFRVYPHSMNSESLGRSIPIVIAPAAGDPISTRIVRSRQQGTIFIVKAEGIDSIAQVEQLLEAQVLTDEANLAPLEDDEFYWYEVIGMEVVTDTGDSLGKVESVIPTGANDVLQVRRGRREYLLPNIPDVVREIDRDAGRILVHLLPGLID